MAILKFVCPFCAKDHYVKVDPKAFEKWINGELIQRAMPELSATEREQCISHMCPDCQNRFFGDDED